MHSAHSHIMFFYSFIYFILSVFSLVEAANVSAFFNKQT